MSGASLSPFSKVGLYGAAAAVHLGLLSLAATTATPDFPETGGAPVINLTLSPSPRFDGRNAPETSAGAAATPAVPTPPRPASASGLHLRPTPEPTIPVERLTAGETTLRPPADPGPAPTRAPAAPVAATGSGAGSGAADRTSRAGVTEGGGAPTTGAAAAPLEDAYGAQVIAWLERRKGRPQRRIDGVTTVRFVLDRQGRVRDSAVLASSGDGRLDATALDAVRAAQPYPRPPSGATWRTREFRVRLDYRPRDGGPA